MGAVSIGLPVKSIGGVAAAAEWRRWPRTMTVASLFFQFAMVLLPRYPFMAIPLDDQLYL